MAIVPKPPKGGFMAGIIASGQDAVISELKQLLATTKAELESWRRVAERLEGEKQAAKAELTAIHRIAAHVAGVEPITDGDTLAVRRVKEMAQMINWLSEDLDQPQREGNRYRFLLRLLIKRGVVHQYENGTWVLRGIYGVDDSGLRGAGKTPNEAIDNAMMAERALLAGGAP